MSKSHTTRASLTGELFDVYLAPDAWTASSELLRCLLTYSVMVGHLRDCLGADLQWKLGSDTAKLSRTDMRLLGDLLSNWLEHHTDGYRFGDCHATDEALGELAAWCAENRYGSIAVA